MKKTVLWILALFTLIPTLLYWLNPVEIYKLTENTAQFVPLQTVPDGIPSLRAADCGVCHQEIYAEWKTSLHARAYDDPFFQAYHRKDKGDPTCLVCHSPLQNQSPVILSSASGNFDDLKITPNPDFDPELQGEGVTCSACHVRDGVIYGPYPAADMNAPHPVGYDREFLEPALCNRCHEVPSKEFSLMRSGVCSTGEEFANGHWVQKGYTCQHCHMPEVTRPLMAGHPERPGRKHLWRGGFSDEQLAQAFSFRATLNDNQVNISVTNSGAGHQVPTGDPDRFIELEFYWQDREGTRSEIRTIKFKRQVVWQPIMFVWSDNRLAPGESTGFETLPATNAATLRVDAIYNVMTEGQLQRLQKHYGLTNEWSIRRKFLSQEIPIEKI